ncbi:MAG: LCP family protein, partial [Acidaminococcaceae bacterium]|nr:LCP family protein [Acidaminococcaceae bacterium]
MALLSGKKNIVVMGCDIRKDDVGRSDTLFVVMLDKNNKQASLLSIPRDTRVKIKDRGWDKINAAFAYGGQDLTRSTVQDFLGIRLHNYVVVDFQGFKDLVDVIGGVDINVEKRMYYYDPYANF